MSITATDLQNIANNPGMLDRLAQRIKVAAGTSTSDVTLNKAAVVSAMDLGGYTWNGCTSDAFLASVKAIVDAVQS